MNRPKVLITGAASGIGKATAIRFAKEGYDVCLNDIQHEKLADALNELTPGDHIFFNGSYAGQETINKGEKLIGEKWGKLDALVSCAGIFEKTDPLTMDMERWRVTFDAMINGCVLTSKLAVKFMQQNGRLIHVTSIHGTRAEASASAYSMAKAAINQFCRAMAVELAPRNILVNAIAPGFVDTPMAVVDGQNELHGKWFKENYIDAHHLPLKRAATAEEIAGVAFFLAGNDASYITGQVITVDGGLTITF
ncbi:MAG: SDR family oxidoreductase [Chitinophagaceae bacterium]|nr:SDR family oxidoreductase [Chitinophagaceae bacterium]